MLVRTMIVSLAVAMTASVAAAAPGQPIGGIVVKGGKNPGGSAKVEAAAAAAPALDAKTAERVHKPISVVKERAAEPVGAPTAAPAPGGEKRQYKPLLIRKRIDHAVVAPVSEKSHSEKGIKRTVAPTTEKSITQKGVKRTDAD